MNDNSINPYIFENLKNDEKIILCKTIAKIFTKRLLLAERSRFFPDYVDGSLKIEMGLPENFTIPGPEFMPYGWIADAKFKVFSKLKNPDFNINSLNLQPIKIVLLDVKVGENAFFAKEKRDIMNYLCRKRNDIVLSCFINEDKSLSKLSLQFFYLHPGKGWKKIDKLFYSSSSDFNNLTPTERGEIGESLGAIFAKRLLFENRSIFFPEFDKDFFRIEEGVSIDCSTSEPRYYSLLNSIDVFQTMNSWIPDKVFQILTSPDILDLKYESFPKKIVYLEVKTGKNARFERWQKGDIGSYNQLSNYIVIFCQILPENNRLALNFKMMKDGCSWETIKKFHYSDFL